MKRDNISWVSQIKSGKDHQLSISLLFNNIYYQTPGGLTMAEYKQDPKKSRPAVGMFPSAIAAKAAIYQKNFLAGLNNHIQISPHIKNLSSVYGAFALVENPTVRNYEIRREPHLGARTNFEFTIIKHNNYKLLLSAGGESQFAFFNTKVSDNINGKPGQLQTDDDISYKNYGLFTQVDLNLFSKFFIIGGLSINKTKVNFLRLSEQPINEIVRTYRDEFSPRISILYKLNNDLSIGSTFSEGFSPPTISELLPSTGNISTDLEAESGINYEFTIKKNLFQKALKIEITSYYFKLENALVIRKDNNGADYFINAGNTKQLGIEAVISYSKSFINPGILTTISFSIAWSFNNYKYNEFKKDTSDFSGKYLPGIPDNTLSIIANADFKYDFFLNLNCFSSSSLFLNDANIDSAVAYNLIGFKLGKKLRVNKSLIRIKGGVENLLNETYSLGNDINDPRGRYYNVAPGRNYFMSVELVF